jgi:hypothetical protein
MGERNEKMEVFVMTDAQIFQLLGLAYTAMGLGGLIRKDVYKKVIEGYANSTALLLLSGLLALTLGFLLVTFHNVWVMGLPVIITVVGWLALIKGLMILILPGFYTGVTDSMRKSPIFMRVAAAFILLLGIFFLLLGFWVL